MRPAGRNGSEWQPRYSQTRGGSMVRTSASTGKLNAALAKAQAKFEAAIKGNVNPAFRSNYADVSSIIDATLSHLNSEAISIRQHPSFEFKGEGDSREAFVTVT